MLHTFEAHLNPDPEMCRLLQSNAGHWSFGLRKAWSLAYGQGLSKAQVYAELSKLGFTSKQVGSLQMSADMKHAALAQLKQHEIQQLELAISKRSAAISEKERKLKTLERRRAKVRTQRDKAAPASGKERSQKYRTALAVLRDVQSEISFCRNWVKQKRRVLAAKWGKLHALRRQLDSGQFGLCFGSKELLRQRPGDHNAGETPFASVDEWRRAWDVARNGQWWAVGHTDQPSGNSEVQWLPEKKQLRIRLTDLIAYERMDARGVPRSGGRQKDSPLRMKCRFVVIDGVDFVSHKGAARKALIDAFGNRPVTMRVLSRVQEDGSLAWYVQASLDVPTGFEEPTARSREAGVLGLDFNARGVAWCAVKPDGNRLVVDGQTQAGLMSWGLRGLTDQERKQAIGTVVAQLARHAKLLALPLAIENLDFATKKLTARAGAVNKQYNDMLSSLPSAQFAELVSRACEKQHLKLYLVNPSHSSVGGFTKYGMPNRMNADTSAALWVGRQALMGAIWKSDGARNFVKKFDERLVFSHLPATRTRSTKALAGAQWKDVACGVGTNRRLWGAKLRQWFLCRVEAASLLKEEPAALAPSG
ncbi:MAG TPA: hypothetical protein VLK85_27420 [Ramlibacter sp.]|nr:hypothetical protein [Ramlibacter sp.]